MGDIYVETLFVIMLCMLSEELRSVQLSCSALRSLLPGEAQLYCIWD